MFRALILALLCSAWAPAASAQASQRPALHWSRGSGAQDCIDPRALALQVTALTGPVLVDPTISDLSIEGHIEREADGELTARIVATEADGAQRGERLLKHRGDCRALDGSLAFVIAMLINPDLALEKLPASLLELGVEGPAPEQVLLDELERHPPQPLPPQAPAAEAIEASAPPAPEPRHTRWELQAGALVAARQLPNLAYGGLLSAAVALSSRLRLEALAYASRMPSKLEVASDYSVRAAAFGAALSACPHFRFEVRVDAEGCIGGEAYLIRAQGKGFQNDRANTLAVYALRISLGVGVSLWRSLSLRLRGTLNVALNRSAFTYQVNAEPERAFRVERVAGGGSLGAVYEF